MTRRRLSLEEEARLHTPAQDAPALPDAEPAQPLDDVPPDAELSSPDEHAQPDASDASAPDASPSPDDAPPDASPPRGRAAPLAPKAQRAQAQPRQRSNTRPAPPTTTRPASKSPTAPASPKTPTRPASKRPKTPATLADPDARPRAARDEVRALAALTGRAKPPAPPRAQAPFPGMDSDYAEILAHVRARAELRDLHTLTHQTKTGLRSQRFDGSAPQVAFWQSTAKIQGFVGGIGSGKTYSGAVKCLLMPAGTTILACAPTYVMLRDGAWKTFWEVCHPYIRHHNKARFETVLTNGTTILWRATMFADRLRGINAGAIWLDEAGYVSEAAWKVVLGRLRRAPGILWITSTPKGKRHWLYNVLVGDPDRWTQSFHSPTRLNRRLPPSYIEMTAKNYGGAYRRQELEGEFVEFGGTKFQRSWFDIIEEGQYPRAPDREVRFWDLAVTQDRLNKKGRSRQKDATASLRGCFHDGHLFLRWGVHMKEEWPSVRRRLVETCLVEPGVQVGVEAYGGGWVGLVQDLKAMPQLISTDIQGFALPGDKSVRAARWSHLASDGRVHLVQGPWVNTFLDEVEVFGQDGDNTGAPESGEINDDFVDAASGVVGMLEGGQRHWLHRLLGM